jgi:hypothetical protein
MIHEPLSSAQAKLRLEEGLFRNAVNPSMGASRKTSVFCDDPEKPFLEPELRISVSAFVNHARCASPDG